MGPIPPPFSLYQQQKPASDDGRLGEVCREVYSGSQLNGDQQRLHRPQPPTRRQQPTTTTTRSSIVKDNNDVYRDFESIYESMRLHRPQIQQQQQNFSGTKLLNQAAVFETEQLARSLADVEEALQRARSPSQQPSPSASSIQGGKLISVSSSRAQSVSHSVPNGLTGQAEQQAPSPVLSIDTASELTTRADSRNTSQSYQMGPALVEEMTLSDLEDEISLSLMETSQRNRHRKLAAYQKEGQYLLRATRSRNPLPASVSILMSPQRHHLSHSQQTTSSSGR